MKECKKCGRLYDDSYEFCPECGNALSERQSTARSRPWQIVIMMVAVFSLLFAVREYTQIQSQKRDIAESQRNKAIEEYQNTPKTDDLTINSDWDYHYKGNYIYIEGSVSNNSPRNIGYYEIGVKFLDSKGNVLDTDWTNGTDLYAGDTQQFEVMHKHLKFSKIRLYVKEVN